MAESNIKRNISIIEEGTSGIWTYRKWSDGTSECWGKSAVNSAFTVWSAPIYYTSTYIARQNFPSGLFIETPKLVATLGSSSGNDGWIANDSTNFTNANSSGRFYMLRVGAPTTSATYEVNLYAIGKWR